MERGGARRRRRRRRRGEGAGAGEKDGTVETLAALRALLLADGQQRQQTQRSAESAREEALECGDQRTLALIHRSQEWLAFVGSGGAGAGAGVVGGREDTERPSEFSDLEDAASTVSGETGGSGGGGGRAFWWDIGEHETFSDYVDWTDERRRRELQKLLFQLIESETVLRDRLLEAHAVRQRCDHELGRMHDELLEREHQLSCELFAISKEEREARLELFERAAAVAEAKERLHTAKERILWTGKLVLRQGFPVFTWKPVVVRITGESLLLYDSSAWDALTPSPRDSASPSRSTSTTPPCTDSTETDGDGPLSPTASTTKPTHPPPQPLRNVPLDAVARVELDIASASTKQSHAHPDGGVPRSPETGRHLARAPSAATTTNKAPVSSAKRHLASLHLEHSGSWLPLSSMRDRVVLASHSEDAYQDFVSRLKHSLLGRCVRFVSAMDNNMLSTAISQFNQAANEEEEEARRRKNDGSDTASQRGSLLSTSGVGGQEDSMHALSSRRNTVSTAYWGRSSTASASAATQRVGLSAPYSAQGTTDGAIATLPQHRPDTLSRSESAAPVMSNHKQLRHTRATEGTGSSENNGNATLVGPPPPLKPELTTSMSAYSSASSSSSSSSAASSSRSASNATPRLSTVLSSNNRTPTTSADTDTSNPVLLHVTDRAGRGHPPDGDDPEEREPSNFSLLMESTATSESFSAMADETAVLSLSVARQELGATGPLPYDEQQHQRLLRQQHTQRVTPGALMSTSDRLSGASSSAVSSTSVHSTTSAPAAPGYDPMRTRRAISHAAAGQSSPGPVHIHVAQRTEPDRSMSLQAASGSSAAGLWMTHDLGVIGDSSTDSRYSDSNCIDSVRGRGGGHRNGQGGDGYGSFGGSMGASSSVGPPGAAPELGHAVSVAHESDSAAAVMRVAGGGATPADGSEGDVAGHQPSRQSILADQLVSMHVHAARTRSREVEPEGERGSESRALAAEVEQQSYVMAHEARQRDKMIPDLYTGEEQNGDDQHDANAEEDEADEEEAALEDFDSAEHGAAHVIVEEVVQDVLRVIVGKIPVGDTVPGDTHGMVSSSTALSSAARTAAGGTAGVGLSPSRRQVVSSLAAQMIAVQQTARTPGAAGEATSMRASASVSPERGEAERRATISAVPKELSALAMPSGNGGGVTPKGEGVPRSHLSPVGEARGKLRPRGATARRRSSGPQGDWMATLPRLRDEVTTRRSSRRLVEKRLMDILRVRENKMELLKHLQSLRIIAGTPPPPPPTALALQYLDHMSSTAAAAIVAANAESGHTLRHHQRQQLQQYQQPNPETETDADEAKCHSEDADTMRPSGDIVGSAYRLRMTTGEQRQIAVHGPPLPAVRESFEELREVLEALREVDQIAFESLIRLAQTHTRRGQTIKRLAELAREVENPEIPDKSELYTIAL